MNEINKFKFEREVRIKNISQNTSLHEISQSWIRESMKGMYVYNFEWLGRPIIQFPEDMVGLQELIWTVKPDLIIETGIAHGGSLVLSASMLALLDMCEAIDAGIEINPKESKRKVLGIDIDIRNHNRAAIESHPMSSRIQMIQGSSISPDIIAEVHSVAANYSRIMVMLDSNHTHDHVFKELKAYAPLTSLGSYCCVFDTFVEDVPKEIFPDRPWGPGDNPKTAVWEYLKTHSEFEVDRLIQQKLQITVAPDGYLKRIA
jgi:cephalosporin hydroxylase